MEMESGDVNALHFHFAGVKEALVVRMGAAKAHKLSQLIQRLFVDCVAAHCIPAPAASAPMLCALDFDGVITRKRCPAKDAAADLSSVIGRHRTTLLQALCELLAQSRVTLVVVSFNSRKVIEAILEKLNVRYLFHAIYDQAAMPRLGTKEDRQGESAGAGRKQILLEHLMCQHKVSSDKCVLVDDDHLNLAGARCKTVLVRGGRGLGALEVRQILQHLGLLCAERDAELADTVASAAASADGRFSRCFSR